ncbi:hypothetical protein [Colwellia psychrerythraea]|uniref:Uncharacterized protein n=1 Tax=Colwellia psychrerythraea TaxID=28229 RepID=A0A099KRD6_COLPS|nr:hypothetical protein [Colwellia psychrerythraea]KGJ92780.1 hypothetical protein GAB14E_2696 [Colwellia psychrerythraea]
MSLFNKPAEWMNHVAGDKSKILATIFFHAIYTTFSLWMLFNFIKTAGNTYTISFTDILLFGSSFFIIAVIVPALYLYGAYRLLKERKQKSGEV